MRRLAATPMFLLLIASRQLLGSSSAKATVTDDPAACTQHQAGGICDVVAAKPAGDPSGGSAAAGSTSQTTRETDCTADGVVIPCQIGNEWWVQSWGCYASLVTPPPPLTNPAWAGHTDGAVYNCRVVPAIKGTSGFWFWSATRPGGPAVVDPVDLAQRALKTLVIPSPTMGRYPAGRLKDGRPYTVVNAYTWYWSDAASFTTLTARATAGGVWSQVTVTPSRLTFTPGDGSPPVSCAGPGVAWQRGDGVWAGSPTGCDYRYPHSSIHQPHGVVTATYGIRWEVTWTSSTGAAGTLPGLTTTATSTFAVAEVESVVVS
jgi:hypothetical protein